MKCPACNKHIIGNKNFERHLKRCEKYVAEIGRRTLNDIIQNGDFEEMAKLIGEK